MDYQPQDADLQPWSSGGTGCMGRDDCIFSPAFQLTCPHQQPTYKACSKCFVKLEIAKCKCEDEDVTSSISSQKDSSLTTDPQV